ncbi:hypothetical protein CPB84DRAFT_1851739 [Gymnopilus junonius]|uniref:Uncharacterized protein n=1 Tax=Gymnopilus junonius TaxID=109634 RepID=A0A9P5TH82_GYMJU|nr:hypothetical protein CPB84DRAFT_1851739 [Gymnopilus junonius]
MTATVGHRHHQFLPNDVLETVISNLDTTFVPDRTSLHNLSYTNYILKTMCQKQLFSDTYIVVKGRRNKTGTYFFEDNTTTGRRFLQLIRHSPHLARYVQVFNLNVYGGLPPHNSTVSENSLSNDAAFPLYVILPQLLNIRKFAIRLDSDKVGPPSWSKLDTRLQEFFTDILQRLPQVNLRGYFGLPPSVFANCPALKELHIARSYRHASVEPADSFFMDPWFTPESGVIDLTGLKTLEIQAPVPAIAGILRLCSGSLESLDFRVQAAGQSQFNYSSESQSSESMYGPPVLDLSDLCNLRELTIHAAISQRSIRPPLFLPAESQISGYDTDLPYVASMLRTLSMRRNFPILKIRVFIKTYDIPGDLLGAIAWSQFVGELLTDEQWTNKDVVLEVKLEAYIEYEHVESLSGRFRAIWEQEECLKRITEKGLVRVFFQ